MPTQYFYEGSGGSTDPFIDDPTAVPRGGGPGGRGYPPYNPGVYGGSGGAFYGTSPYSSYAGYGGQSSRRRQPMVGSNLAWQGGSAMPVSQAPPQTSGAGGGGGGGSAPDYWDVLMGRFGGTADQPYSHAEPSDVRALLDQIIAGNGRGAFGPMGDPRVMAAYDADATRRGLDQENAAVLGATYDQADPWNRAAARTMARANASRGRWDFYNQNRLGAANRYADLVNYALQHKVGEYDWSQNRSAQLADRNHDSGGGGWGQILGPIVGAGVGAFFGNPGAGAALGGQVFGGGNRGGSDYTRYNWLGSGQNWR